MSVSGNISVNTQVSTTKSHKNLTFQDALIAIAVYAAQIDPDDPDDDIKRIENLAKKNSLFQEETKEILARIFKFANAMSSANPLDTVELAANSLTPKYRETAYKWATELVFAKKKLPEERKEILDWLRVKLLIDSKVAQKLIAKKSSRK